MSEFVAVDCAVLTISDTRTLETDRSGAIAEERLKAMGHRVVERRVVIDDVEAIQGAVREFMASSVDVLVLTGGTGPTRRDVTPEAVSALATKHIQGFGELFRWLSYQTIGASTIQSRAEAYICDGTLVFALPGSTGAVKDAFSGILEAQLDVRTRPCNFIELLPRIR